MGLLTNNYIKEYKIYKIIRIVYYFVCECIYKVGKYLRKYCNVKSYDDLYKLKNQYKGERCFIIATGPSLRISDLEKLEKEYTFSMNSIVKVFNKTKWRPDFYGCQDVSVYKELKSEIEKYNFINKFIGSVIEKRFSISNDCTIFPLELMNHCYNTRKFHTKFSDCCDITVYDGYTITYSLLQIAVYMGFNEIYLLGADCNYNGDKKHFIDYKMTVADTATVTDRLIFAYTVAEQYARENNIKIYNATRGGMLNVFERINFDDIKLKTKK